MRTIVIRENTELPVDDELASAINKMLAEDSTLPIKIKDHTVSFADYTVGSLQVGEVNRNKATQSGFYFGDTV